MAKPSKLAPKKRNGSTNGAAQAVTSHGIEARIRTQYAALPESERKIADLILEFPGEVAAYSATEIAGIAGASKAAVTRLIRRLGYDNFEAARRASRDAQNWGSPLYLLSSNPETGGFTARVQNHIEQDARNISLTFEGLRGDVFKEIVAAICGAKRVYLLGYRNSHYLAAYARWQIVQVREDVHLLPAAGETLAEYIADLQSSDILIVVGFRRRVAEIGRIISAAARAGARILYLTDWNAGTISGATWTVPIAVRGKDVFDRYSAAISFLHFLCVEIVARTGESGRKRINRIEYLHNELHDFD